MKVVASLLAASIILTAVAVAQMEAPKPGPEVKKLEALAGSWSLDANMKASSMGPGGTVLQKIKCEWQEGGFFMTCHSDYSGSMGSGVGLTVYGYSNEEKSYTYHEFNSWGEYGESKGAFDGDTWTWSSDMKMGGMTMKARFVMKWTSKTSYNFMYDMSQDGTKWNTVMDGKATKM